MVFLFQILLSLLLQTTGPFPAPPTPTPVDEPAQDVALRVGEEQTINLGEVNLSLPYRYGASGADESVVTSSFENRPTGDKNTPGRGPLNGYAPAEALLTLTGKAQGTTTMTVRNCEPDGVTCNDATRTYTLTVTVT